MEKQQPMNFELLACVLLRLNIGNRHVLALQLSSQVYISCVIAFSHIIYSLCCFLFMEHLVIFHTLACT